MASRTEIIDFGCRIDSLFIPSIDPIEYDKSIWPRIFDNVGLEINKDTIMIPVLKGIDMHY